MNSTKEFIRKNGYAAVYVIVFQVCSLLALPYMLIATGYSGLFTKRGVLSFLFDLGMASLPRAETIGLSFLYRVSNSEIAVYFSALGIALLFGIGIGRLLQASAKTARITKTVLAWLLAADLVLRILPFSFNLTFGWAAVITGFVIRAVCLALVLVDLRQSKAAEIKTSKGQ